jgi:hypothetical protein
MFLEDLQPRELVLLITTHRDERILDLVARLAVKGPLKVIDGGGRFDADAVTQILQSYTGRHLQALNRIKSLAALTCYQLGQMLEAANPSETPLVILDLLDTFYAPSVSNEERYLMLGFSLGQLNRLRRDAPVITSVHQPDILPTDRHRALAVVREFYDRVEYLDDYPASKSLDE